MAEIQSLAPIAGPDARVLILGSIPGVESLRKQQYYSNPRNQFWRIFYTILDLPFEDDYPKRLDDARKSCIALWDVIGQCYREGSLDSSIRREQPNDLGAFIKDHPQLKLIAFNGTKAYATYQKYFGKHPLTGVSLLSLPSTSPTPGRYNKTFEEKLKCWKEIKEYL